MQNHKIFEQFPDFCSIRPGEDKPWTVGTEHRQLQIYDPEFETAKAMKQMMVDHLKRRYFIIDADISVSIFCFSFTRVEYACLFLDEKRGMHYEHFWFKKGPFLVNQPISQLPCFLPDFKNLRVLLC